MSRWAPSGILGARLLHTKRYCRIATFCTQDSTRCLFPVSVVTPFDCKQEQELDTARRLDYWDPNSLEMIDTFALGAFAYTLQQVFPMPSVVMGRLDAMPILRSDAEP